MSEYSAVDGILIDEISNYHPALTIQMNQITKLKNDQKMTGRQSLLPPPEVMFSSLFVSLVVFRQDISKIFEPIFM